MLDVSKSFGFIHLLCMQIGVELCYIFLSMVNVLAFLIPYCHAAHTNNIKLNTSVSAEAVRGSHDVFMLAAALLMMFVSCFPSVTSLLIGHMLMVLKVGQTLSLKLV